MSTKKSLFRRKTSSRDEIMARLEIAVAAQARQLNMLDVNLYKVTEQQKENEQALLDLRTSQIKRDES